MTSDEIFVNRVWKKYNNYINSDVKDQFFKKHQYKNIEIKRKLSTAISSILGIIATTGVVYASVAIHNDFFIQKDARKNPGESAGYEYYYNNMLYSDGIYYKRIYNYNEYIEVTKIWNNLVEMNESDFDDSFALMIAGLNYKTTSLYISNIYVENNKTCVELKRKDKWSSDNTVISAKVPKELDRDEIEIKNLPNVISTSGKYTDLNEITIDYTVHQAVEDGSFVVENYGEVISSNKDQLDEFIEKKENGVIRIYRHAKEYFTVSDVEYNNGVININERTFNLIENESCSTIYFTGNKIKKAGFYKNQYTDYVCSNELGDERIICTIKNN